MKKNKLIIYVAGSALLGVALFFFLGFYNIAANNKHWKLTELVLEVVRDSSISRASVEIVVPDNLDNPKYFVKAAGNYDAMCSGCHLAPGVAAGDQELRMGLYPQSPDFTKASEHSSARRFWVIKHGIKMTGMPAWGASHSDEATWKLVAFINQLPKLDKKRYAELVAKYGGSHMPAGGHGGDSGGASHGEDSHTENKAGESKHGDSHEEQPAAGDHGESTNTPTTVSHGHVQPH